MSKIIVHIDLNAFFATAEEIRNPSLVDKPVIIGGDGRKGIVSTASYPARKFGIRSGMPTFQAKRLCPQVIILPVDFRYYGLLSREFFAFVRKYSKKVEKASVDECYVDMTETLKGVADVHAYLVEMQNLLLKKTGLKCSIGVGPTKFLAKMASDMKKPMGLTILRRRDIPKLLYPLPIRDFYGIGRKTSPKLEATGIKTIGDLAKRINADDSDLHLILGKFFFVIKDWVNGYGNDELDLEPWDPKSIGNSSTFMHDTNDFSEIKEMIASLAKEVSERAQAERKKGSTVQIVIKDTEFKTINRSMTFEQPTNEYEVIFDKALTLLERHYKGQLIRLVGVTLQNLIDPRDLVIQMSLFDYRKHEEESTTKLLINELNRKLKKPMLIRASEIDTENKGDKNED
ncbi:MAG: DNA polymerase IV [Bacilli bacterium]|jgi:DNA polymerase-4|nr:DNA polymerase IV [Bacilli bacterium]MDD4006152.1 DNA polymerase IV [Bacilli bacterium]